MQLYTKILIGLVAGGVVGFGANILGLDPLVSVLTAIEPFGTAWIRAITMIVIPLVVASLLVGTASLGDITKVGRIGGKTLIYYMCTTAIAVSIGLVVSNVVQPGGRIDQATRDQLSAQFEGQAAESMQLAEQAPSLTETLLNMIPRNPVQAAAEMDLLPLIVFTILFGAAVSALTDAKQREAVVTVFEGINEACMVLIHWIMKLAPYAVFALIAAVVARFGLDLLRSLLIYSACVAAGLVLHATVTYSAAVRVLGRYNPVEFYRRIPNAQL
ncbi:MAG: cation:dicarboxylase symporter family transporter, partial [Gemmatimonadetes bacterium]|nr:dicarboxylate/amino acid:cation symporter [Gemmatimonadota bacterium]NIR77016.1 dicarboxylate/amino acid:cation symporter [Gemmatimonadota bacterium]NIT85545.1 dicarboxylate/amino acid:cation symporter [Gemmatimonadota bacterium]NIU29371.1 dicarboxylate/amino acid:cation symporter [Gemmatimonadota bacterium]NIU34431.1 cation:dicarboxylase symporter family transporter [Gemmatimonadota bacterium]